MGISFALRARSGFVSATRAADQPAAVVATALCAVFGDVTR